MSVVGAWGKGCWFEVVFWFPWMRNSGCSRFLASGMFVLNNRTNELLTDRAFSGEDKNEGEEAEAEEGQKRPAPSRPPFPIDASRHERKRVTGKSPQMFPF